MIGLVQIRNTSEAVDPKGVYTVFNVYVNGCYHGAFRYSQLLALHQEVSTLLLVLGVLNRYIRTLKLCFFPPGSYVNHCS